MTPGEVKYSLNPSFIRGTAGNLFSLYYQPTSWLSHKSFVVFFPPFAEEMNKSRRMVSLQAQRLARLGYGVLIVDPFGTGDSEGDFGDATVEIWREDMRIVSDWIKSQGAVDVTLWGLRLGALLAVDALPLFADVSTRLLLWSPVVNAKQFMNQFFRLRLAADLIQSSESKETVKSIREQIEQGTPMEVAGYQLSTALVKTLDTLVLKDCTLDTQVSVTWCEIVGDANRPIPVPVKSVLESWDNAGVSYNFHVITGSNFWNTPEITLVPELLNQTTAAMTDAVAALGR